MASYTQARQPLAIRTPLGEDALLLAGLQGTEAISELFHFALDLLAPSPVSFDDLLGKPATVRLTIPGGPMRYVNGVVSSLEQGHQVQGPLGGVTFTRYTAELVPELWLCGLRHQSRVFQSMAVPDIVQGVLRGEWRLDVRSQLAGTYPARDYCVQYRETDLAFVRRLLEEEGICFYFTHTESKHTLVLADGPDGHPDLAEQSALIFDAATGGRRPEGRVTTWSKKQALRPCKVTLRDHCFQLPTSTLEASASIQETLQVGQKRHTLKHSATKGGELLAFYDHLGGYAWRFDGVSPEGTNQPEKVQGLFKENQRVADLRAQAEATAALTIDGASLCGHLLPGCKFALQRHFDGDGGYLLTSVSHKADLEAAYLSDAGAAGLLYENRFRAVPAATPFRPARQTPRPRIDGVLNAQVVGPKGGEIFVDRYGRVKVKFFWDREQATGPQNSCWLRVGQVWAGNRWGAFFWPRVGHEVIVSFVDGNPDRPLITGSVYNENHMPPFELPQHRTLAGIKSNTATQNADAPSDPLANYSGWLIEDAQGQEHIEIHGERHIAFYAEETERHIVDGPHRLNVNGTHSVHVGSLPGGSGSGGGRDPDHPYIINEDTPGKDIGIAVTSTCGIDQGVILGLYSTLTVGDYVNVVVNPLGMVADLGLAIPGAAVLSGVMAAAAAPTLGYTNITMGSQVQLSYGTNITVTRGAKAAMTEMGRWSGGDLEDGEGDWAALTEGLMALSAAFATAGVIQSSINAYDTSQGEWIVFLAASGVLAAALETAEVYRAVSNQVAKAKEAATAATALSADATAVGAIADTITSMFGMDPLNMNTAKLIKGNTAEYNDAVRMIGADQGLMLFSGALEAEQTALTINPTQAGLFLGVPEEGPRMLLDADEQEINVAIGPVDVGSLITLTPGRIGLTTGAPVEGSSIIMNEAGITLQSGECKIILTVEGTITLQVPGATLALADGAADLNADEALTLTTPADLTLDGMDIILDGADITIDAGETTMT